jgi:DNA-binding transcriptional ArsR family regulator
MEDCQGDPEPQGPTGLVIQAGRDGAPSIDVDNSTRREIVRHMLNCQDRDLDRVFAALVDPTRREILARLEREDTVTISALAAPFAIKLPAVMKHLDVLGAAGLITRSKHGRTVDVRLSPERLREAAEWLARYERFWSPALDRLAAHAEAKETEAKEAELRQSEAPDA